MNVALRPLRDGDDAALLAIHIGAIMAVSDEFYDLPMRQSWAHGLTEEGYGRARAAGEVFTVAVDGDDRPIGFCGRGPTQILGLYVAAGQQGRGIGSALLGHGESKLVALGVTTSRLISSLSAVEFYRAHGYRLTGHGSDVSRGGLLMAHAYLEKPLLP